MPNALPNASLAPRRGSVLLAERCCDDHARMKARSRPRGRITPVVAYAVSGIIGGTAGLLVAMDAFRRDRSGPALHPVEAAWIPPLATMVAIVSGVLVAWFLTAVIVSRAPGRVRCPRCGTANRRSADSCTACQLSFS
jgi:hypothetical protein